MTRVLAAALVVAVLSGSAIVPASAQMREQLKYRIVDAAANAVVSEVQSESCAEFANTLKNRKSGSSGGMKGMMKSDPSARARFVNRVAGPLVNKMIDCDLIPGR